MGDIIHKTDSFFSTMRYFCDPTNRRAVPVVRFSIIWIISAFSQLSEICSSRNTSFFPSRIFVRKGKKGILLFSRIVTPRKINNCRLFPGESAMTSLLRAKGSDRQILKIKFLSPITKVTLQKNCQESIF